MLRSVLGVAMVLVLATCNAPEQSISVRIAGDVLLDRTIRQQIEHHGLEPLEHALSPWFEGCDVAIANLECPATAGNHPVYKRYTFRAEPAWLGALSRSGVTHLDLANNHSIDQGRSGLAETVGHIENAGMEPIGAGPGREVRYTPTIIQEHGLQLAVFAAVDMPIENWTHSTSDFDVSMLDAERLIEAIKTHRSAHPGDRVLVLLHWGNEYQTSASLHQRQLAHALVDAGADAIVGHHPHVVQTVERFQGMPIVYSVGNFVFDSEQEMAQFGVVCELTLSRDALDVALLPYELQSCYPVALPAAEGLEQLKRISPKTEFAISGNGIGF